MSSSDVWVSLNGQTEAFSTRKHEGKCVMIQWTPSLAKIKRFFLARKQINHPKPTTLTVMCKVLCISLGTAFFSNWNEISYSFFFIQGKGNFEQFHTPAKAFRHLDEQGHILERTRRMQSDEPEHGIRRRRLKLCKSSARAQIWIQLNIQDSLKLHHRHVCTVEAHTVWQIWSTFAEKSGQISPSWDVPGW